MNEALGPRLVIGVGNRLRGDDGAGALLVEELIEAQAAGDAAIEALVAVQLTPELAPRIAAAGRVLFVDASLIDHGSARAQLEPLSAAPAPPGAFSHHSSPEALLDLAQQLYGRRPPAWLLRIPAAGLELGAPFSATTTGQLDPARGLLRHWLDPAAAPADTPHA